MHLAPSPFVRTACLAGAVVAGLGLLGGTAARSALQPVFQYTFPDSSSDLVANPNVTDRSPAGNHGMVSGTGLSGNGLSSNVPPGMTGQSVDFTATGTHTIRTTAIDLLNTTAVANAGGFTFDVWVYPTSFPATGLFKIIDYAGTENISLNSTGQVRANLNSTAADSAFSAPITLNQWHHIIMQFDSQGNPTSTDPARSPELQVFGEMSVIVDGIESTTPVQDRKGGYGDQLNRVIGIGGHPTSTGERFLGLIYNPTVSLGIVPEPASLSVLAVAVVGLISRRRRTA